jgi:hypothetical protein
MGLGIEWIERNGAVRCVYRGSEVRDAELRRRETRQRRFMRWVPFERSHQWGKRGLGTPAGDR